VNIGIVVPVLNNWSGFAQSLSTWTSKHHRLRIFVVDNSRARRSIAASWNLGCRAMFAAGVDAVIVANDDVLCHEETIDRLVAFWRERRPLVATAYNVRDTGISIPSFLCSDIRPPYEVRDREPDMSFFILPKRTWELVGEFDENFFPGYFEDNDYYTRVVLSGGEMLLTTAAPMYHLGGQTQFHPPADMGREQVVPPKAFQANRSFYITKWGCQPHWHPEEIRAAAWKHPYNDPRLSLRDVPRLRQPTE